MCPFEFPKVSGSPWGKEWRDNSERNHFSSLPPQLSSEAKSQHAKQNQSPDGTIKQTVAHLEFQRLGDKAWLAL